MEFNYSEELLEIKRTVREFAEKEIRPHVHEWDEKQIFPLDVLKKLADLGFMGVLIPHEYGGAGLGYLEYVAIVEELSRVDGSVGISVAAHNSLCTGHIYNFGNEEQRRKFVVPLAKGEKLGAWSLTEPEAGSDAGGTQTVARLEGDHWVLNGQKTFTTHGTYGDIWRSLGPERAKNIHDSRNLRRHLRCDGGHRQIGRPSWHLGVHP